MEPNGRILAGMACVCTMVFATSCLGDICLDGAWDFRFEEGKSIAETADTAFAATDRISVPGCYDMMPKWLCQRGTGLYRRKFVLEKAVQNAWLVVDGMGLTGHFRIDGKDLAMGSTRVRHDFTTKPPPPRLEGSLRILTVLW